MPKTPNMDFEVISLNYNVVGRQVMNGKVTNGQIKLIGFKK